MRSEVIFLDVTASPETFLKSDLKRVHSENILSVIGAYIRLLDPSGKEKDYPSERVRLAKVHLTREEQKIVEKNYKGVSPSVVYWYHVDYEPENFYVYDFSFPGKYPDKLELFLEDNKPDHHFLIGYSLDYTVKVIIPHQNITGKYREVEHDE